MAKEFEVPVWFLIEADSQGEAWEKMVKIISDDFIRYEEYGVKTFTVEEPHEMIDFIFADDILPDYDEDKPLGDEIKEE